MLPFELDHLFIATTNPAAAEESLSRIGLAPTVRRAHPGQGTANFCIEFENAYLEILFATSDDELHSPAVRPLCLHERIHWPKTGASPFGIALRPSAPAGARDDLPVDTWPYKAPYLPPGASIPIITPPDTPHEPLLFVIQRTQPYAPPYRLPRRLAITSVTVSPDHLLSRALRILGDLGAVNFVPAREFILDLTCEGATTLHDQRPTLPLRIRL